MDFFCGFGRRGGLSNAALTYLIPGRELGKYPFPALTSVYEYLHHLLLYYNRLSRDMPESVLCQA